MLVYPIEITFLLKGQEAEDLEKVICIAEKLKTAHSGVKIHIQVG